MMFHRVTLTVSQCITIAQRIVGVSVQLSDLIIVMHLFHVESEQEGGVCCGFAPFSAGEALVVKSV